jgi:DNA mismatch endonuclease (patch repair protein)
VKFWADKLNSNRRRDNQQIRLLLHEHWRVLVVWECALNKPAERDAVAASAISWIKGTAAFSQIPRRTQAKSRFG